MGEHIKSTKSTIFKKTKCLFIYLDTMNNTMIAQTYLPHQFVDPRKLNFRMNPYEMANQQAQMQQIFLRQQMQQRYVSGKLLF